MMKLIIFICLISIWIIESRNPLYNQPEQIHLSIGNTTDTFVITWVTLSWVNETIVLYGNGTKLSWKKSGTVDVFKDGGSEKREIYMHRVTLENLAKSTVYNYIVGSRFGWSEIHRFTTFPAGSNWPTRFVVIGDMGNLNARSMAAIQRETEMGLYDMLLHVGDFAYDLDTSNAQYGDQFMRQIQPIASQIPYMTVPGNHEQAYNFSNYRRRFTMPGGDGEGQFYSFNVGFAHIIGFSSEYYYYTEYGFKQIENQYIWLQNDLKEANKPENRILRPWIIAMGHRPMYCSNSDDSQHCVNVNNYIRVGIPISVHKYGSMFVFGLEKLFYNYGVDLIYGAHEHSYERMWPVYNLKVCNGTSSPYTDPPAPVHIVTGSAGNQEGEDPFFPNKPEWSAFHASDYGYTRMNILNSTHLYMEQVSDDMNGKVIDKMLYIRNRHGQLFNCEN